MTKNIAFILKSAPIAIKSASFPWTWKSMRFPRLELSNLNGQIQRAEMCTIPRCSISPRRKLLHVLHKRTVLAKIPIRKTTHTPNSRPVVVVCYCAASEKGKVIIMQTIVVCRRTDPRGASLGLGLFRRKKKEEMVRLPLRRRKKNQVLSQFSFPFQLNFRPRSGKHTLTLAYTNA